MRYLRSHENDMQQPAGGFHESARYYVHSGNAQAHVCTQCVRRLDARLREASVRSNEANVRARKEEAKGQVSFSKQRIASHSYHGSPLFHVHPSKGIR
jgi:hypothetical protein